jgi:hypothetical protein
LGELTNSIYGTVYSRAGGRAPPVAHYAGCAPLGFGHRRWAREQLTVQVGAASSGSSASAD